MSTNNENSLCQMCNTRKTSVNYIWDVWNQKSYKIKKTSFTLRGFSVAAFRTNFYIKELNIMFDGGVTSNYSPTHVFITHLHTDHIANCPWHFDPGSNKNVNFYVPEHTGLRLKNFLESAHPYVGDNNLINQKSNLNEAYNITEVVDGKPLEIILKGKKYLLEIIRCYHTVRCTSYGIINTKHKLKPEYINKNAQELKELKNSGINITDETSDYFFLFIGDTGQEILLDKRLEKYTTIMIECTFLEDSELENAELTKHIHWKNLKQYVLDHPNITFILYHFSSRYKRDFINHFFENENIDNLVIWNNN